jgi:outer membrane cobalamin receptor
MENTFTQLIAGFTTKFKAEALNHLYYTLQAQGHNVAILNEKYLEVDGNAYQLRASKGQLIVKPF